eukprot:TRINITY_DN940_c0_g2_i3.p1 TRINITY_DN940_c0_g2~~TRINITY_DN940_c0_g2_i3.p1  ORF type:complete len:343 (+),score=45.62 TRINITY_DN940_c0_g2_i3:61-1089(+)
MEKTTQNRNLLSQTMPEMTVVVQKATHSNEDLFFTNKAQKKMDKIFNEFKEVCYETKTNTVLDKATEPPNRPKNRYLNVLPTKDHAVTISPIEGVANSDYINADLVTPPNRRFTYICCQAPLPSTIPDFWRMIWERQCTVIVMLTKKADVYWPEEGKSLDYNTFSVHLNKVSPSKNGTIVRKFFLKSRNETTHNNKKDGNTLTSPEDSFEVTQLHFEAWPDFGVPENPEAIQELLTRVQLEADEKYPIVVHCSAGIGRTGTFVALHVLMNNHLYSDQSPNVKKTVLHLRSQRMGMVQTKEQYLFIYASLDKILKDHEKRAKVKRNLGFGLTSSFSLGDLNNK